MKATLRLRRSDGHVAEIPPGSFGDTTSPHPIAGSPLRLFVLDAAEAAGGELDRGVSFLFDGDDSLEYHRVERLRGG
jgi:hypothetical protein